MGHFWRKSRDNHYLNYFDIIFKQTYQVGKKDLRAPISKLLGTEQSFQICIFQDFKNAPLEILVSNCGSKRDKLATFGASHVHYFERCARNLLMVKGRK